MGERENETYGCLRDDESDLRAFVRESNRIEGIRRAPTAKEIAAHKALLALERVTVEDLCAFVREIAGKSIRDRVGMNVYVGDHRPPPGSPQIPSALEGILFDSMAGYLSPYQAHQRYEHLHPFMDGNGRSGRALWLWMMARHGRDPYAMRRGFLHSWYYQSLSAERRALPART